MNLLPCFGKYNINNLLCRRLCIRNRWKCKRETTRKKQSQRRQAECLVSSMGGTFGLPDLRETRLDCFGHYDDQVACGFCKDATQCFQLKHYGVGSSFAFKPTNSSAIDTGATRVEGGSDMNSKDFETRKTKAQELEVVSVANDFLVKSATRQGGYMVTTIQRKEGIGYHCACMDYATHRGDPDWKCKHIIAVEMYLEKKGPTNGDSRYDLLDLK